MLNTLLIGLAFIACAAYVIWFFCAVQTRIWAGFTPENIVLRVLYHATWVAIILALVYALGWVVEFIISRVG